MASPDLIGYKLYRDRANVLPGSNAPPRFHLEFNNLPERTVRAVLDFLRDDGTVLTVNLSDRDATK